MFFCAVFFNKSSFILATRQFMQNFMLHLLLRDSSKTRRRNASKKSSKTMAAFETDMFFNQDTEAVLSQFDS